MRSPEEGDLKRKVEEEREKRRRRSVEIARCGGVLNNDMANSRLY